MPITTFANNPSTTAGGTDGTTAPSIGAAETWGSTTWTQFAAASSSAVPPTQFNIADPAHPGEIITVTNSATGAVIRGAEGTTPVAHSAGATYYQIISAGDLTSVKQATGAVQAPATLSNSLAETIMGSYQPVPGEIVAGTMFDAVIFGTYTTGGSTRPTLTWRLRWGGLTGTVLCTLATGTNAPAIGVTTVASGASFDLNGNVTFIDATHATANLNFWYQNAANLTTTASNACTSQPTTGSGGISSGGVVISGAGPLVLTAQWSAAQTYDALTAAACNIYRSQ